MEDKKMLNEEELEKVNGGIAFDGQEYDSVQVLDKCIEALNEGDWIKLAPWIAVCQADQSQFVADIEKAGRTIPDALREVLFL